MREKEALSAITQDFVRTSENAVITPLGFSDALPLSTEGYRALPPKKDGDVIFVDGGDGTLLETGAQHISLLRLAGCCYNSKRLWHERISLLVSVHFDGENAFVVKLHPLEESAFTLPSIVPIDLFDAQLTDGKHRISTQRIISMVRKVLELEYSHFLLKEKGGDALVMDGSFSFTKAEEENAFKKLNGHCNENNVVLAALAKSSAILTTSGLTLTTYLKQKENKDSWWYFPLTKEPKVETQHTVVKLHPQAQQAFRLDAKSIFQAIALLQQTASDPIFLGYPYGLVEADNLARVTKNECEQLKLRLHQALHEAKIPLQNLGQSHAVLDSIKF